jgi:hypothetical protein
MSFIGKPVPTFPGHALALSWHEMDCGMECTERSDNGERTQSKHNLDHDIAREAQ